MYSRSTFLFTKKLNIHILFKIHQILGFPKNCSINEEILIEKERNSREKKFACCMFLAVKNSPRLPVHTCLEKAVRYAPKGTDESMLGQPKLSLQ